MKKHIAVTGSGGFIGQYLQNVIEDAGDEFIPFDRQDGFDVLGDNLNEGLAGATTVIHLAGMLGTSELFDQAEQAVNVNVNGTLRVLRWCQNNGAGFVGITMPDSSWKNVYQSTKLAATRLASAWHESMGVPVSHVRAFNAYGPGQKVGPGHPQKILPTFATLAWAGKPLPVWGNGHQTVDLVHAKEVAEMLYSATSFGDDEVFDAGTGIAVSVNRVADFVNKITGNKAGIEYLPMRPGETPDTNIIARGEGWPLAGWTPEFNWPWVEETVNFYRLDEDSAVPGKIE